MDDENKSYIMGLIESSSNETSTSIASSSRKNGEATASAATSDSAITLRLILKKVKNPKWEGDGRVGKITNGDDPNKTWDSGTKALDPNIAMTMVPEKVFSYLISSSGKDNDVSIMDTDNDVSRTEFDSHANMIVVGKIPV